MKEERACFFLFKYGITGEVLSPADRPLFFHCIRRGEYLKILISDLFLHWVNQVNESFSFVLFPCAKFIPSL